MTNRSKDSGDIVRKHFATRQISYEHHFEKIKEQAIKKKSPKNLKISPHTHRDKAQKTTMEGGRWREIGDTMLPVNYRAFIFVD